MTQTDFDQSLLTNANWFQNGEVSTAEKWQLNLLHFVGTRGKTFSMFLIAAVNNIDPPPTGVPVFFSSLSCPLRPHLVPADGFSY